MKYAIILIYLSLICSCSKAQPTLPRINYLKGQDHSWVEIKLEDDEIYETDSLKIDYCQLSMSLNNEVFLKELLHPYKKEDKIKIKTGFKTIVPVGTYLIKVVYEDCTIEDNKKVAISFEKEINIEKDAIVKLEFDKDNFIEKEVIKEEKITLEDIDKRLSDIEEKITNKE